MVTLKDAKDVANSIVKALNPASITLFGSVAREGSGADLDLLIVTGDRSAKEGDDSILLHRCLKRFYKRFAIDPFIIPLSVLKDYYLKGSPFLKLISKEGRTLYMKGAMHDWIKQSEDE